jgi:hypothetical protein
MRRNFVKSGARRAVPPGIPVSASRHRIAPFPEFIHRHPPFCVPLPLDDCSRLCRKKMVSEAPGCVLTSGPIRGKKNLMRGVFLFLGWRTFVSMSRTWDAVSMGIYPRATNTSPPVDGGPVKSRRWCARGRTSIMAAGRGDGHSASGIYCQEDIRCVRSGFND